MEDYNLHGKPSNMGKPMYVFIGYTDEDRARLLSWLAQVEPTGFTGMVTKGVRPAPPEVEPIMEIAYYI